MELWSNSLYQTRYKQLLEKQQFSGEFCDVLIIPDETTESDTKEFEDYLYAHACILAAASPVLYDQISKIRKTLEGNENGIISIKVKDVGEKVWQWILKYIYHGKIRIEKEEPPGNIDIFVGVLQYLKIVTHDDGQSIIKYQQQEDPNTSEQKCSNIDDPSVIVFWQEKASLGKQKGHLNCDQSTEKTEDQCGLKLCNVGNANLEFQSDKSCQTLIDTTEFSSGPTESYDTQESKKKGSTKDASNKSKRTAICCIFCNKSMRFSKNSGKSIRKVKNPTCDSCKIKKQRGAKLKPKAINLQKKKACKKSKKTLKSELKTEVSAIENEDSAIKALGECIDEAKDGDCEVTSSIIPQYSCFGCGRKLKRYSTYLRHKNSCMLNPHDVMLQLKTERKNEDLEDTNVSKSKDIEQSEQTDNLTGTDLDESIGSLSDKHSAVIKQEDGTNIDEIDSADIIDMLLKQNGTESNTDELSAKEPQDDVVTAKNSDLKSDQNETSEDITNETTITRTKRKPCKLENIYDASTTDDEETDLVIDDSQDSDYIEEKLVTKVNKMPKMVAKADENMKTKPHKAIKHRIRKYMKKKNVIIKRNIMSKLKPESTHKSEKKVDLLRERKRRTYKRLNNYNICNLCGEVIKDGNKEKLVNHKRYDCKIGSKKGYVHGPRRVCPICFKQLSSTYKLNFHLKVVHLGEFPYECLLCDKRFKYRNAHRDHMMSVHEEDLILCSCCNQYFNSVEKYHRHKSLGLISKGEKMESVFMCEVCGETFYDRSNYRTHRLFHMDAEEWKHKCELCDKHFPQKVDKDRHMMIHTGEKPFLCDICSYSTNRKYNLKLHQRKHEAENSESLGLDSRSKLVYSCKNCDEQFKLKTELKTHLKIHDSKICITATRIKKKDKFIKDSSKPNKKEKVKIVQKAQAKKDPDDNNVLDLLKMAPLNPNDAHNHPSAHQTSEKTNSYQNAPALQTEVKPFPNFTMPSNEQTPENKAIIQDRANNIATVSSAEHLPSNINTTVYSDRYNPMDRLVTGGSGMSSADTNYGVNSEIPQAALPYPYRGPGFVPYSTRGVDGWNLVNKDSAVSSLEEAFRIIGIPSLVPVSAVDLSAATTTAFITPPPNLTGAQEPQYSMMTNAYNPTQNYQQN